MARLIVPRERGKAFPVKKGQVVRVIAIDGQQVCDFNAYNQHNLAEAFWSGGTRGLEGTHARAIRPFGLPAAEVHDAFNIFMKTGVRPNGKLFYKDPDVKKGDYMDLRAEMDCLMSVSACPGKSSGPKTRRLGVEIFEPAR